MKLKLGSAGAGHLLAVFCILAWAATFIVNKLLFNDDFNPLAVILLRKTLALLLMSVTCAVQAGFRWPKQARGSLKQRLRRDWRLIAAGLIGIFIYYLLDNYSVKHTFATNASLLMTISPIFTALISRYIAKETQRFGFSFILGSLCCFFGAAMIIFNGSFVLRLSPLGDMLAIGAALLWAVYSSLIKRISTENAAREHPRSEVQIARDILFWGCLGIWIFYLASGNGFADLAHYTGKQWGMIAYLGVGASYICLLFWNGSIARIGAVKCSLYMFATPLLVILASAVFLEERLRLVSGLGAVALLLGLALAQGLLDKRLHRQEPAHANG